MPNIFSAVDVSSSELHLISSFLHEKRQCRIFKNSKSSAWILNVEHLELGPIITEHAQIAVAQNVEITTFKESRLTDSPYEIRTFVADEDLWSILLQRSINEVPDRSHEVTPCSTDLFNRKRSTENRCCFAVYKFCKNSVWAPRRRVLCVSAIRTRVGSQSGHPEPPTKPTRKYVNLAQLGCDMEMIRMPVWIASWRHTCFSNKMLQLLASFFCSSIAYGKCRMHHMYVYIYNMYTVLYI